jgi:FSR family fosmidomycin resistance protein-like MFS transporter
MLLAGLGNALFHVGAGAVALDVDRGKAWAPGVFVAPGAAGLFVGLAVGRSGAFVFWPFTAALAVAFALALLAPMPQPHEPTPPATPMGSGLGALVVGLLLFSVAVRAFVGSAGAFACPKSAAVPIALTAAAVLGKGAGGFLADRFGWRLVAVGALLLSAPLIAAGGRSLPWLAAGMLLFQMTMPVTLAAVYNVLRGRPALSFGLACAALVAGAIPTYFHAVKIHFSAALLAAAIVTSAVALFAALGCLAKIGACGPRRDAAPGAQPVP